jgi:hypothetical protein
LLINVDAGRSGGDYSELVSPESNESNSVIINAEPSETEVIASKMVPKEDDPSDDINFWLQSDEKKQNNGEVSNENDDEKKSKSKKKKKNENDNDKEQTTTKKDKKEKKSKKDKEKLSDIVESKSDSSLNKLKYKSLASNKQLRIVRNKNLIFNVYFNK